MSFPRRIFVSAPMDQHLSPHGLAVKASLLALLRRHNFEPQQFGESGLPLDMGWTFDNLTKVIKRCQGAMILALARHRFDVSIPGAQPRTLLMPSEWSHCEGAVAISKGIPTFVIADQGVEDKGIAYTGNGKYVLFVPAAADAAWVQSGDVQRRLDAWIASVKAQDDVFFGYCSQAQATADAVIKFLTKSLGLSVKDWAVDFNPGQTILNEIIQASRTCRSGIFLFTKDDPLDGQNVASPRDNVLLEAGYFLAAKGKERVLIIREDGAKMPADLGGDIYVALKSRTDTAAIETKLRQFLTTAL